ncbi:Rv2732c family membrane protein [Saccharopolyspora sp. 5N708]|uniref:Rv2732c family membrane protein n=1 Tax=Saccharopolyspora sp. 5N708 TaxID=3457424 RepID=UPI003FCFF952
MEEPDEMSRRELARSEREILRRFDPGSRALVIASVILVLVLCSVLPWVDGAAGWQVLTGETDPQLKIGLLPRLFAINSTIVGIGLGALALITRRWVVAFLAGLAGVVVSFEGLVAIWSRQTSGSAGPSIGLVLAVLCMAVLAVQWMRIVWSRT